LNDKTPVLERYSIWLRGVAHGDFGKEWDGQSVNEDMSRRLWVSGQLLLIGTILGGIIGIAAGAWAAVKEYRLPDLLLSNGSFLVLSVPVVVLAILFRVGGVKLHDAVVHKATDE